MKNVTLPMNLNISLCLTDLKEKGRGKMMEAANGKIYINLDVYIKDELDKYDKDVAISISRTKEEAEASKLRDFVGNGKSYPFTQKIASEGDVNNLFSDEGVKDAPAKTDPNPAGAGDSDDLPF